MEIYYHIKSELDAELHAETGIEAYVITLQTASEDGYETVAVLSNMLTEEKELLEQAWRSESDGGNPSLVLAVINGLRCTIFCGEE